MTTKERTLRFIAYKGLSVKKFEEMCGLSNGYVNSMKSGYGSNKLLQVLRVFPELNRDWLVYGEGEMLIESATISSLPDTYVETDESFVSEKNDVLEAELRAQIEKLEAKVDKLNQELGEKSALIRLLREGVAKSV